MRSPILHRVQNILAHHLTLRSSIVTASRITIQSAILITEVVSRNSLVKRMLLYVINMVVNHIHNHTQTSLMKASNHLLSFLNSRCWISRIRRVRPFRNIVVLRIITPVLSSLLSIAQVTSFIHRTKIIHWHDLHVSDTKRLQIIKARNILLIFSLSTCFYYANILTTMSIANTRVWID